MYADDTDTFCKPSTVVKWEYFYNYRNVKTSKKNPKNGWLNEDSWRLL